MSERLEQACGDCHDDDGDEGIPPMHRILSEQATVMVALHRVSRGQMPPNGLPIAKRAALIEALCESTESPPSCNVAYSLGTLPALMRPPWELIGDIKAHWKFSEDALEEFEGVEATRASSLSYESPTTDAVLVIGATNSCKELAAKDPTVRIEECVRSIISREFVRAPAPEPIR